MALNSGASYVPTAGEGTVPQWHGVYSGSVVSNHDPLGKGRLQLYVPQVLGTSVSSWAVPMGMYLNVPANGATVSVSFIGGDPSQPAWHGTLDLASSINTGSNKTTYSSGEPPSPQVGDIWYPISTALGGEVVGTPEVWTFNSGTSTFSWVTQPSIGTGAITPGAITEALLGSDVTGAINGKSTAHLSTSLPTAANSGDIWMQINSSGIVISIMSCTTTYTSGGTLSDWTTETSMSARAIGSPFVYQQSLTPNTANNGSNPPQINDLWIATSNSNAITQMTGGSSASPTWTTFQMGANAIQNGSISANHIAVGTVVAGIVNGTSIIATGTSGDFLAYSGTPATGNLVASLSPVSGSDSFSNSYLAGFQIFGSSSSYAVLQNNSGLYGAGLYARAAGLSFFGQPAAFSTQTLNAGSSTIEQQMMVLSSGKETNGTLQNDSAIQLRSAGPDGTRIGNVVIEFGGTTMTTFDAANGIQIFNMSSPIIQLVPSGTSSVSQQPFLKVQVLNASAGNEQMFTVLSSGKESGLADAALQLFAEPADASGVGTAIFEFGGATGLTIKSTGIDAPNYHAPQSVSGWPIAAGSGTVGPAQLTSGLASALNSIYNAGHAAGIW